MSVAPSEDVAAAGPRPPALFGSRLLCPVDCCIGIQDAGRIGQGRARIQGNRYSKCLSYLFAGRSGLDCAVGTHANAAVAACGDADGEGDELVRLRVKNQSVARSSLIASASG